MKRMLQLDGVRGIAVGLVVLHHWTATGRSMDLGNIGVQLFFVLSGFLITGILLNLRSSREAGAQDLRGVLFTFWQSRASRIWPVCFLTLAAVFLAGDRFEKREDMIWHLLFASNLLFFLRGEFGSNLAHFWTLAVEQQFYVFWPFAILLLPRRYLEPTIIALVVAAPLSRLALYAAGYQHFTQYNTLPFASLDSLGLGSLTALWTYLPESQTRLRRQALSRVACLAALCFATSRLFGSLPANMEQTFYALVFAWLIATASEGMPGFSGRLLESRPLVALGAISYAVYVYHMFAPRLVGAGLRALDAPADLETGVPLFMLSAILTVTAAGLSWVLLENPINTARRNWQSRGRRLSSAFAETAGPNGRPSASPLANAVAIRTPAETELAGRRNPPAEPAKSRTE